MQAARVVPTDMAGARRCGSGAHTALSPLPRRCLSRIPPPAPPAQWLTKETAASHALKEIVKQFNCSEQGAKSALTRRGIAECKVRGPRDPPPTTPSESARRWESLFGVSTFFNLRF